MQSIDISGTVQAGIVNIGGSQYFWGDVVVNVTYIRQRVITCPTAPNPPAHFTGRKQELDDLRTVLASDQVAAITAVRTMGGMGKTTLAQALCHLPDKPFDAVLWAYIGQEPQSTSILMEWARYAVDDYALKPDAKPEEIAGWVRGQLTQLMTGPESCGTRWLVVFDDVWDHQTCYDALKLLQTALPPGVKTLITTRQAETASQLSAKSIELYEMNNDDALALLQRLRDNRHLTDDHLKRAVALVKGHPLTLELAAASLNRAEDGSDITHILDEYERGIRDGSPFDALNLGVETPRSLNVVFGRSYTALPPIEQSRFRALGILASDAAWKRPLAGAVWELKDERAISDAHKALRLRAFIQQVDIDGEAGEIAYRQHPLLRAYARALLNGANETEAAFGRYADVVIETCKQFRTLSMGQWDTALSSFYPHIHYVGDELAQHYEQNADQPIDILTRCSEFSWRIHNYLVYRRNILYVFKEGHHQPVRLSWLTMGLKIFQGQADSTREARTWYVLSHVYDGMGQGPVALSALETSLKIYQQLNDPRSIAVTQSSMADLYVSLGRWNEALALYEESLATKKQLNDPREIAVTQINLAQHFINRQESLPRAITLLWAGYETIERLNNPREIAQVQGILTSLKTTLGTTEFDNFWQAAFGRASQPDWLMKVKNPVEPSSQADQAAQVMQQLAQIYQQQGADAVRQMLAGKMPDEVIEQIMAQLAALPTTTSVQNTLPADTIQTLTQNTTAVKTGVPDQLADWRETLTNTKANWIEKGDDYSIEVAFVEALLAILGDQTPTLPADNPYADVVQQVITAITHFKENSS